MYSRRRDELTTTNHKALTGLECSLLCNYKVDKSRPPNYLPSGVTVESGSTKESVTKEEEVSRPGPLGEFRTNHGVGVGSTNLVKVEFGPLWVFSRSGHQTQSSMTIRLDPVPPTQDLLFQVYKCIRLDVSYKVCTILGPNPPSTGRINVPSFPSFLTLYSNPRVISSEGPST